MARIKTKQGAPKTLSCKFGGMGRYAPLSPLGAEEVRNFRILPNGGMRVRSGYILKKHFIGNQPVRGVWEGTLGASSLLFAVAGNTIYLLSGDEMTETAVGTVSSPRPRQGCQNMRSSILRSCRRRVRPVLPVQAPSGPVQRQKNVLLFQAGCM